jgi:hypothetical protein
MVSLGADNTLTALSGFVPAWGDSYDSVDNGVYDPENNTLKWDMGYAASYTFHIVLTKE